MIRHHLKLILRTLWANRVYSFIILLSLTVGFTCSNVLISFLVFEKSTDGFHINGDRTYQLFSNDPFGGTGKIAYIPDYFPEYLVSNYGEIERVCQVGEVANVSVMKGNEKFDVKVLSVDSSFFTLFDFPLQGEKGRSLTTNRIVLSTEKALVLFGSTDVIGQGLTIITPDTTKQLVISAVVEKSGQNSHLFFDALVHHSTFPGTIGGGATYALLNNNNAVGKLAAKINSDPQRPGLIGKGNMEYFLNPLRDSYFNTDNKMGFMRIRNPVFLTVGYVVCGLVLFIATFNFINLFLLASHSRRKEVGIRKTLGVTRQALFSYLMAEAGVYVVTAFFISLVATYAVLPVFNSVFETGLSASVFLNPDIVVLIAGMLVLTALAVVLLSVIRQWNTKPISLMTRDSSKIRFSRVLFTIQFVISTVLAICAVTIMQQMNHIESAPLGFNRHIIQLNAPEGEVAESLPALKQRVLQLSAVANAAVSSGNPVFGNMVARYDLDNNQFYSPYLFSGDEDFIHTLNLKLVEGTMPAEGNDGKLVNQTLVRKFNMSNPIGAQVPGTKDLIIGVVEDFTCGSFKQEIPPAIISLKKGGRSLLIDYSGTDLQPLLPELQSAWKSVFPDHTFSYRIIQDELMKKYKEDTQFYRIVMTFSIISIVLSSFGLFALSWAVVQSRTKEMGIRKVLGATAIDIANLLTWTFTKRIFLSFLIAGPIAYYVMQEWLTRFANRISLNFWIFGVAAVIVILIAFITLSLQTIKATLANPVDEIRNE